MDIRPAQRFSWSRKEAEGEDPDIGLPVTYKSGRDGVHQQQQAEAGQDQPLAPEEEEGPQRAPSRERWSFSPPRNWVERPSRPLTRSVAARRQRERAGHR